MKMIGPVTQLSIQWQGPFAWPGYENETSLHALPTMPGVYIQAFEYQDGFLVSGAGITKRSVATRLREHTRKYLNGEYTVLDAIAAGAGVRTEVWHGWGYARAHRNEFEAQRESILRAARRQLASYRVFVTDPELVAGGIRLRERLEAGIMDGLYDCPPPMCDFPDRGMFLSRRRSEESPCVIRNECSSVLYGLPQELLV